MRRGPWGAVVTTQGMLHGPTWPATAGAFLSSCTTSPLRWYTHRFVRHLLGSRLSQPGPPFPFWPCPSPGPNVQDLSLQGSALPWQQSPPFGGGVDLHLNCLCLKADTFGAGWKGSAPKHPCPFSLLPLQPQFSPLLSNRNIHANTMTVKQNPPNPGLILYAKSSPWLLLLNSCELLEHLPALLLWQLYSGAPFFLAYRARLPFPAQWPDLYSSTQPTFSHLIGPFLSLFLYG